MPPGPPDAVIVRAYLPQDATYRSSKAMIEAAVRLVSLLQPMGELQERSLEEAEWESAWKSHFSLLRVGRRLLIRPSWQECTPRDGEAVVVLDPGMAFGTGYHPTTRMCLEQLEQRVTPRMRLLDLGTGSGILAIAAAKLGVRSVVALDSDPTAVESARANVRANSVGRRVKVIHGTLPHPEVASGGFHMVVANVTAKAIANLMTPLMDCLSLRGVLVLSGIIQERLAEVEEALGDVNAAVPERASDGDWVTLVVTRAVA